MLSKIKYKYKVVTCEFHAPRMHAPYVDYTARTQWSSYFDAIMSLFAADVAHSANNNTGRRQNGAENLTLSGAVLCCVKVCLILILY